MTLVCRDVVVKLREDWGQCLLLDKMCYINTILPSVTALLSWDCIAVLNPNFFSHRFALVSLVKVSWLLCWKVLVCSGWQWGSAALGSVGAKMHNWYL